MTMGLVFWAGAACFELSAAPALFAPEVSGSEVSVAFAGAGVGAAAAGAPAA